MGEDEDFPYLKEERRAYRRNVTFTIVAVLLGVGVFVLRLANKAERDRDVEAINRVNEAMASYRPATTGYGELTAPAPALPDLPPIELAVLVDGEHHEVDGDPIPIDNTRELHLRPAAQRTFVGDDVSFRYGSSIRVRSGTSIMLSTADATAQLGVVDLVADDAADLAALVAPYESTGQVTSTTPTERTVLGKKVRGARLEATGLVLELLTAKLDKKRRLRIIITGNSSAADLTPLVAAVETTTAGRAKPTPDLEATLVHHTGKELGRAGAIIGKETSIGKPAVAFTVKRLPMVKEQLAGMRFEHAAELSAIALSAGAPAVQMRDGEIGIQLVRPPMTLTSDDALQALAAGGLVQDRREVTRSFGGTDYRGVAGSMSMGDLELQVEVYVFLRGNRDFIAMLQYPAGAEATVERLAGPPIASVK
jgi:hypothetical protein